MASATATLFGDELGEGATDAPQPEGPFAAVALEQSIDRMLDYAIPPKLADTIQVGQRVKVPLGKRNRATSGYVIAIHPTTSYPKIKTLIDIEDARVLCRLP